MSASLKVSTSLLSSARFRAGPPSHSEAAWVEAIQHTQRDKALLPPVLQAVGKRLTTQFARRVQRSPDREASVRRRRTLGGSSSLPATIRASYTEGERAALAIIAQEVRANGCCDLPLDRIAAVAGVSRTTAQNALRQARALGHVAIELRPRKGRKNLTNVVRIIAPEWLAWLKHGGRAAESIGFKPPNPTKMQSARTAVCEASEAAKRLGEEGQWRRLRPKPEGSGT